MGDSFGSEEHNTAIEDFFGFQENPFGVTPDPRYFYNHPLYADGLNQLARAIQAKKGVMLLTGEAGTGKTTLLRTLMRHLSTTKFIFVRSRHLAAFDLLELTATELGLSAEGISRLKLTQQLEEYLIAEISQNRNVAILIDEAQELSEEALQGLCDLSNLETDKEKLLQIVLAGQPELVQRLSAPSLQRIKQRVAMLYRLERLQTLRDLEKYVRHRLKTAGHSGQDIFDRQAIEAIWAYTGGTLRLINVVCDNALPLALAAGRRTVSAQMIEKTGALLMLDRSAGLPSEPEPEPVAEGPRSAPSSVAQPRNEKTAVPDTKSGWMKPKAAAQERAEAVQAEAPPMSNGVKGSHEPDAAHNSDLDELHAAMASIRLPAADLARPADPTKAKKFDKPAPPPAERPRHLEIKNPPAAAAQVENPNAVPAPFFDFMVHEATEALGPIGEIVVQEHITGLGETRQTFPRKKLLALVEAVSSEISNKQMRANFETIMRREIRGFRTF